jgi:hypothetical protein
VERVALIPAHCYNLAFNEIFGVPDEKPHTPRPRRSALQGGIQHCFDVLARLHLLKAIVPVGQAGNAADDEV